jgi:aminomethyltransferase
MITRMPNSFFLVVNAACKEKDFKYLQDNIGNTCEIDWVDAALMALQGPLASQILKKYSLELASMPFLSAIQTEIDGISCLVHRCGYTGEDGYEISVSNTQAEQLARILLQDDAIEPAGLGARDSLRLEAGLCLYGHDLDETTSPIEADLSWIIAKKYRVGDGIKAFFPGADIILEQLQNGPARIRRGFIPNSRIPVREGTTIINSSGEKIGIITSGGYGQSIGKPVCIGYLDINADNVDDYQVVIRDKTISLARINLPFVNHRYYK